MLDAADVPVLQVVLSGSAREAWASSPRGLSPADLAMNVVLPELDGRLLTRAISFKAESAGRSAAGIRQRAPRSPSRIASTTWRGCAAAWAQLARARRAHERRLALVLSDYPGARRPHRLCRRPRHAGERRRDPAAAAAPKATTPADATGRPPTSSACCGPADRVEIPLDDLSRLARRPCRRACSAQLDRDLGRTGAMPSACPCSVAAMCWCCCSPTAARPAIASRATTT